MKKHRVKANVTVNSKLQSYTV